MLEKGLGVKADQQAALLWLQRAAKAGDPNAQLVLGRKISLGEGITADEARGFAMFEKVWCT